MMLGKLIKIRLKGLLSRTLRSSKYEKKNSKGKIILYSLLIIYAAIVFIGIFGMTFNSLVKPMHILNLDWGYFALAFLSAFLISLLFNVFLVYQEIYRAKDNDLLMAMPLKQSDILLSRIFPIILLTYIYQAMVLFPSLIIYLWNYSLGIIGVVNYLVLYLLMPLLSIALSALVAYLIAGVLTFLGKFKNLVIIIVFVLVFGLYLYLCTRLGDILLALLINGAGIVEAIQKVVPLLYYIGTAISDDNLLNLFLSVLIFVLPFILTVYLLSLNFIKLSTSKSKNNKKIYKGSKLKKNSIMSSLIKREIKHYFSNVMVILNGAVGMIFSVICFIAIIIYHEDIYLISSAPIISQGVVIFNLSDYTLGIALIFVITMSSINVMSSAMISLEGSTLYLLKSLPLKTKTILTSKLLTHLLIACPSGIVLSLALSVVLKLDILSSLALLIIPIVFALFIDIFGLLINLWKPKFDWISETVCVKQSLSATITVFMAMGIPVILVCGYVYLLNGLKINLYISFVTILFIAINSVLLHVLNTWGVKRFESIW